ncbi:MAG: citramalate synthase [Candidatus Marinimicrobia bacterium]|jgi:2-isopropylmalate synthase|nr:citramalate synthase [Candidatus Neomarinimicrobiota bacterium]|tara:strand:- start:367 stop:1968 length:1602 start_codon:yes stop_codon:yes gene_type:complete
MNKLLKPIELFDTTLRDGTQGEGVNLSVDDKLHIALKLDEFGINIIEGGWPGSNPRDQEFFQRAKDLNLKQAEICAFGSTARKPDAISKDPNLNAILNAETSVVTIFGKTWLLHAEKGLGLTNNENLALIEKSVEYLVKHGKRVIFDAEHFYDGYTDNSQYALSTLNAAVNGGADTLVLCDTNGGTLLNQIAEATENVVDNFSTVVGIHAHNDSGLAVANTLAAVKVGASHIQGTINGVGERCGNANLGTIIPNLIQKMDSVIKNKIDLDKLTPLTHYVYELMNMHPDNKAPFVGKSAFAHKGGIHVSAVMKDSRMYEHIDPKLVGNKQRVLVSDLSGQSNIRYKADELNVELNGSKDLPKHMVQRIKQLEHEGYQFEAAEASFELILKEEQGTFKPFFDVLDSRVHVSYDQVGHNRSDVMLKVIVDGEIEHTAADGIGPVHALNRALKKALIRFYPELKSVKLTDYKVRVLNEQEGTRSIVRVLIESSDGEQSWSTVGVSANIIEASWQALRDSLNYKLLKTRELEQETIVD